MIQNKLDPVYAKMIWEKGMKRIGKHYAEEMSFESFHRNHDNAQALERAKAWIENDTGLYIFGSVGSGKTHLAIAAFKEVLKISGSVQWWGFDDLIQSLKAEFDGGSEAALMDLVCQYKYLFLDDIGAPRFTEYSIDVLHRIISRRLGRGLHKILFTSNLSLKDLGNTVDDRIASRIVEMCGGMQNVVELSLQYDARIRGIK